MCAALKLFRSQGKRTQYNFWQSVFGDGAQNRSYFFKLKMSSPVTDKRRLKTFISWLDLHAPTGLICALDSCPERLLESHHVVVRLPVLFAHQTASRQWGHCCLPDPAAADVFLQRRSPARQACGLVEPRFALRLSPKLMKKFQLQTRWSVQIQFGNWQTRWTRQILQVCLRGAYCLQRAHDELADRNCGVGPALLVCLAKRCV